MLLTTLLFLIIQLPASIEEAEGVATGGQAAMENVYALVGLICCLIMFGVYLAYRFKEANEDGRLAAVIKGISSKQISIMVALDFVHETLSNIHSGDPSDRREKLVTEDMERLKEIPHVQGG